MNKSTITAKADRRLSFKEETSRKLQKVRSADNIKRRSTFKDLRTPINKYIDTYWEKHVNSKE